MKNIFKLIGFSLAIMLSTSTINAMSASAGSTATPGAAALGQRLIEAAKIGALETVRLLLEKGAGDSINATDRYHGMTALMYACRDVGSNSLAIVQALLLVSGINVHAVNYYRKTALVYACDSKNQNSLAIVQALLAKGVLVDDDYGKSAFAYAKIAENTAVVDHLREEAAARAASSRRYKGLRKGWLAGVNHACRSARWVDS